MTTPANLDFTAIQTRVMNQLRMPVSNTTEAAKVAAVINEVYRDIAAKQDWWWLLKRSVVTVVPKYVDSAVVLTQGATTLTLSTVAAQTGTGTILDLTGYVFVVPGASDDFDAVYRVLAHGAGNLTVTLDAPMTASTQTGTVNFYQDAYALPADCGKVLNVKRFGRFLPLERMGLEEISALKLTDQTEGSPEMYSVFDFTQTGDPTSQRLLQIHPYPDGRFYRLETFYKQNLNTELSGTHQPFIPDDYRQVLIYGALARGYPIFLNDTERGQVHTGLFNDVMALMSAQQKEYAKDNSGVAPDMTLYRRATRRGRSTTAFTLGSWFDRLPDRP